MEYFLQKIEIHLKKSRGALWEITHDCLMALDIYNRYPLLSDRYEYEVIDSNGEIIKAMSYAMVGDLIFAKPSGFYFSLIKQGYKGFNLDPAVLDKFRLETIEGINVKE